MPRGCTLLATLCGTYFLRPVSPTYNAQQQQRWKLLHSASVGTHLTIQRDNDHWPVWNYYLLKVTFLKNFTLDFVFQIKGSIFVVAVILSLVYGHSLAITDKTRKNLQEIKCDLVAPLRNSSVQPREFSKNVLVVGLFIELPFGSEGANQLPGHIWL